MITPKIVKATTQPRYVAVIFSANDLNRAVRLRILPDLFELRLDGNNFPFTQPNFGNPTSVYNANSANTFGRGPGTRGSFSDVGTGNGHMLVVARLQF